MKLLFIIITVHANVLICESAKILGVIPTPSFSHQAFFRPLWIELAKRGHEVTIITTDPIKNNIKNLHEIDVSTVYDAKKEAMDAILKLNNDQLGELSLFFDFVLNASRTELLHPEVQQLFTNKSIVFDLLMIEGISVLMFILKHRFHVPLIALSSIDAPSHLHKAVGNPVHSILYPFGLLPFGSELNIFDRITALIYELFIQLYFEDLIFTKMDNIIKETLTGTFPSIKTLLNDVDMVFTNSNPIVTTPRPHSTATIVLAGGLHTKLAQNLSKDLETFLDDALEGVIYFSLGSNVNSDFLSEKLIQVFLKTFSQLPYKVLWKFESEELPNKLDNIMIMKWVPQQAVLRHNNVKLFISQAGLQSLEEAVISAVPMITIPFFFDQGSNSKKIVSKGIGVELMYNTLTVDEFKAAILEVTNNDKYAKTIKKFANIILDKPRTPLEEAVWWTEYVLRHNGAKHLKGPTIATYQYFYLDIFACLALVLIICLGVLYLIAKIFVKCLNRLLTITSFSSKMLERKVK